MSDCCYFKIYEPEEALDEKVVEFFKEVDTYEKEIRRKFGETKGLIKTLSPKYCKMISDHDKEISEEYEKIYTGTIKHQTLLVDGKTYYGLFSAYNRKLYIESMDWEQRESSMIFCFRGKDIIRTLIYEDKCGKFSSIYSEGSFLDAEKCNVKYQTTMKEAIDNLTQFKHIFENYNNLYDLMEFDIKYQHSLSRYPESPQLEKLDATEIIAWIKRLECFDSESIVEFDYAEQTCYFQDLIDEFCEATEELKYYKSVSDHLMKVLNKATTKV